MVITAANGTAIPPGTTISAVSPGTGYTLSVPATATVASTTFYVGGATVPPWKVYNAEGAFNSVAFRNSSTQSNYAPVPFFDIDMGTSAGYGQNITFDNMILETPVGGGIWITGMAGILIQQVAIWDAAYTGNLFSFGASTAGYPCRDITVRTSGRSRGSLAAGVYDVFASSGCTNITLDTAEAWGTPAVISTPAAATTLINMVVNGSSTPAVPTITTPAFTATGITGATAASMYAGATASGHPVTGTFAVGNWVIDQTGAVWICTAAGTPGAWAITGPTTSNPLAVTAGGTGATTSAAARTNLGIFGAGIQDPMLIGFNSNYLAAAPVTATTFTAGGASSAVYTRLLAAGYASSAISVYVSVASGNVSLAYYQTSGTGTTAKPAGGQYATSGAVACPAAGVTAVTMGATSTPNLGDWAAMSCDNTTASVFCLASGANNAMNAGLGWSQATAHPLPGTPSSLAADFFTHVFLKGS